ENPHLFILSLCSTWSFFMIYGHRSNIAAISRLAIIERFIIQSALIFVIFLFLVILFLMRMVDNAIRQNKLKTAIQRLFLFIFLLIPATAYIVNVQKTNLSDVYLGDNIGKDVLESATKNSILLLYTDNYIFNSIFVQNAYNVREDVTLAGAHSGFSSLF